MKYMRQRQRIYSMKHNIFFLIIMDSKRHNTIVEIFIIYVNAIATGE